MTCAADRVVPSRAVGTAGNRWLLVAATAWWSAGCGADAASERSTLASRSHEAEARPAPAPAGPVTAPVEQAPRAPAATPIPLAPADVAPAAPPDGASAAPPNGAGGPTAGAPVTAPDRSRDWTLRAVTVPSTVPTSPGPGPHRRWPIPGAQGVELRLHGADPSAELAELWLVDGQRAQFVLFVPLDGGGADSTDIGVTRVGDRLVVWGFNMNFTALYAAMLRASDWAPVGSPVYVHAVARRRGHECQLTVCEARVLPVVDGDRLAMVLVYEGAALFDAPGRRGRRATFAGGVVPQGDWSIESLPPAWTLRHDGARAILEPAR